MDYNKFLKSKQLKNKYYGIDVSEDKLNKTLFPFQKAIALWALRKGRCALFLDTGLGKTHIQTEWARLIAGRSLIVAPLSVARQTVRLSKKIMNTLVHYTRSDKDIIDGINITNYEMIHNFNQDFFDAIVLDESSILKALDGKTRKLLTDKFTKIKYRLCCTATPAPNDETEIGNHSEFLGILKNNEMLATFFINANKVKEVEYKKEDGTLDIIKRKQSGRLGQEWRLRNYGEKQFYKWMSSWAMSVKVPSDIGYEDAGYKLPRLKIDPIFCNVNYKPEGQLFFMGLHGIRDRHLVRKDTAQERIKKVIELCRDNKDQWILWCGLNEESKRLYKELEKVGAVEVVGADSPEKKAQAIEDFQDGKLRILITKGKIAGFGMNFQNAHNMIFVGLSDSWEMYYQCIRREWRFGQKHPVNVYIVLTDLEREIYDNVMAKEKMAERMTRELINNVSLLERKEIEGMDNFEIEKNTATKNAGKNWTAYKGDSCEVLKEIPNESIDVSVYSPPFADLYTYSSSNRDLGNSRDWNEFFKHYKFIIGEVLRITKPGRISCVHTSDIAAMAMKDGFIGLRDFPGAVINAHIEAGWRYHGYAIVSKNPQAQAIRTKAKALLFVQLKKDSSCSRPAILDRVLFFKKPGDSQVPVCPVESREMNNEKWIDWAGGIWTGISESNTLQFTTARDKNDEKHICPLQLGTIERCIKLYSNKGETLLTPFMGIGSEAYEALKHGRRAIGIELKESYYKIAIKNLKDIESKTGEKTLFDKEATT